MQEIAHRTPERTSGRCGVRRKCRREIHPPRNDAKKETKPKPGLFFVAYNHLLCMSDFRFMSNATA